MVRLKVKLWALFLLLRFKAGRKWRYCSGVVNIGLTGGIGSGKSLAGSCFARLGALVVDSDDLARNVIERGTDGFDEIISHFGDGILKNGDINRRALGEIVFADKKEKDFLESIIHPAVQKCYNEILSTVDKSAIVINQIPLLVELNAAARFDFTLTISADENIRIDRLRTRGMHLSEIKARIENQASEMARNEYCDFVIYNNTSVEEFEKSIENFWHRIVLPMQSGLISLDIAKSLDSL